MAIILPGSVFYSWPQYVAMSKICNKGQVGTAAYMSLCGNHNIEIRIYLSRFGLI